MTGQLETLAIADDQVDLEVAAMLFDLRKVDAFKYFDVGKIGGYRVDGRAEMSRGSAGSTNGRYHADLGQQACQADDQFRFAVDNRPFSP